MSNKPPGKWPHYALWANEDATAAFMAIEAKAREAQELLRSGHTLEAVILLGDVRGKAVEGRIVLQKGKTGER
ncbi:MAG: hypothetical protein ACRC1H_08105 [Caldilineaceae bacterium]